MKKQLITTADGSHSYYLAEMDEQYHSKHGSVVESKHIFIEAGLKVLAKDRSQINIFEVGMGTGLNVYLTALAAKKMRIEVFMETIEAFPISREEAMALNYPELLTADQNMFNKIHTSNWGEWVQLSNRMQLQKIHAKVQEYKLTEKYHLVYFDAFAPEKQEEMWTEDIFSSFYQAMEVGGVLVTYCVKGVIRRRLKEIGFEIEKLPGPKNGKREMLRAYKVLKV